MKTRAAQMQAQKAAIEEIKKQNDVLDAVVKDATGNVDIMQLVQIRKEEMEDLAYQVRLNPLSLL